MATNSTDCESVFRTNRIKLMAGFILIARLFDGVLWDLMFWHFQCILCAIHQHTFYPKKSLPTDFTMTIIVQCKSYIDR